MKKMRTLLLILMVCLVLPLACNPEKNAPDGLSIKSSITGVTYPYHVYLPPSYHDDPDTVFPVIYTTDGQWYFDGFSASLAQRGLEYILVAIEEGPTGSDRRAVDYVPPGASAYYSFLTTEFIPLVESDFRIDGDERTIVGTSFGGLLVGYMLFWDDPEAPYFKRYFAFDGSYWIAPQLMTGYMDDRYSKNHVLNKTLVLTSALIGNDANVTTFNAEIDGYGFQDLTILRHAFDCRHEEVGGPSFEFALDEVFMN